ncbi:MAG: thioredoxin fold domain-containing protein [Myxococcales bacterium]|nr:thioredoxin fold domain-containing protein [Myxococcales bacterium]
MAPSAIPYVDEQSFEREILRSELPVLVEFSAVWCGPCKQVEPDLIALMHELEGKAKVVKVDVDKCPALAQELQIKSVPTFMVFKGGRIAGGQPGALRRAQLRAMIEPFLPRSESAVRVEEFLKLAQAGRVVAVDTRDVQSFTRAHIPGALHLPLADIAAKADMLMATGRAAVLYCRAGTETKALAEKLAEEGYPVAFLEGGFLSWEVSGQPIERGAPEPVAN